MLNLFQLLLQRVVSTSEVELTDICRVLESIKVGRRLPESRFAPLRLAQKSQSSVFAMLNRSTSAAHG